MKNQECIRAAYLAHMTPEEKKEYNKRYYQEHKEEYWGVKGDSRSATPDLNARISAVNTGKSIAAQNKADAKRQQALWTLQNKAAQAQQNALNFAATSGKIHSVANDSHGYGYAGDGRYQPINRNFDGSLTATIRRGNLRYTNTGDVASKAIGLRNAGALTKRVSTSPLSLIASSAVSKGKSIVSSFASAWKSGLSSLKSAFTPKTTTTLTNLGGGRNYSEKYTALVKSKSR